VSTENKWKVIEISEPAVTGQRYLFADSSSLLPIRAGYVAGGGMGGTKISRWNEPVHVRAPAHSIPLSVVRRG
jgi:hypothetical protein